MKMGKKVDGMLTRALPLKPETADKKTLTVTGVIASSVPALMYDYDKGYVDEILLMDGAKFPDQIPTLNAHSRWSVEDVIGATKNIRIKGDELIADIIMHDNELGRDTFAKMEAGILTDFSVGYNINVATFVDKGESTEINGKTYTARNDRVLKIAKVWTLKENSIVPIGADETAKTRNAEDTGNNPDNINLIQEDQATALDQKNISERKINMEPENKNEEIDLDAVKSAAIETERNRISQIRMAAQGLDGTSEIAEKCIEDGKSIDEARAEIIEAVKASQKDEEIVMPAVHVKEDETGNRNVIESALMVRAGMEEQAVEDFGEKTVEQSRKIKNISMENIMRDALNLAGENVSSFESSNSLIRKNLELYSRAGGFSTMSLPQLLGAVANKSLLKGYNELPETWAAWVDEQSVSDFKTATLVRPAIGSGLNKVGAGGEIKHGTVDEEYETGRAYTWAELLSITREQIINDDLNAFTNVPRSLGRDARIKIGDEVYTQLLANANLTNGNALVSTGNGNYFSGASSALTTAYAVDAISTALVKFMQMKDKNGKRIGIRPSMLLVPPEVEAVAAAVFNSEFVTGPNSTKSPGANIHRGRYEIVTEARLSDSSFHASASTTAWYMLAPKVMSDSIAVLWLNGNKNPILERGTVDFDTLGIRYRVYEDFGVMSIGYRGIVGSKGAA